MIAVTGHELQGYLLAGGVVVVLITATVAGFILKLRVAAGRMHAAIDNLNARVYSWWIIAGALGLALWGGRAAVIGLFACASMVALREFCAPHRRTGADRLIYAAARWIAVPLQYLFVWLEWHMLFVCFLPLCAAALLAVRAGWRSEQALRAPAGLVLCVYPISYVPALLALQIPGYEGRNLFLLTFLIVITQASDVLQYLWGKTLGRRPIAPEISPNKTVEGAIGGIACASALGVLLAPITPFSAAQAAAISLAVTLFGFLGGLLLSAIKRRRGIKDWSDLIPGHGGILDRLDSLVLSAPFFYFLVCCAWS
jgi:phosphatidate cytidylyltransferase